MLNKFLQAFSRKASVAPAAVERTTPSSRPAPADVSDADFKRVVLHSNKLVVVDCWAEWCEPCDVMSAYMGFLAADYADQILATALDVEENPLTSERYAVMGLPTLLFFYNGVEVDRQVGLLPYEELRQRVEGRLSLTESST